MRRASPGPNCSTAARRTARAAALRSCGASGVNARVAASASRDARDGVEVTLGRLEVGVAEDVTHGNRVGHSREERSGGVAEVVESKRRQAGRIAGRCVASA